MHYANDMTEAALQRTLKSSIHCTGVGVHSGQKTSLRLLPAPANSGITFIRTDITDRNNVVPALWDNVTETQLCTVVTNDDGVSVSTVEHIMAALRGCSIDNITIQLDGPEVPIMDGSAEPFVFLIDCAGIEAQDQPRHVIKVLKPIEYVEEGKHARLLPSETTEFCFDIDFAPRLDVQQRYETNLDMASFKRHLSRARTFGFLEDVDKLRAMGLARGGSLDNAVVISGSKILNKGGLRYTDELVRHKVLDAVGDLYLAGAPIIGRYEGYRSGHALNNQLLHALFADPTAWIRTSTVDDGMDAVAADLGNWQSHTAARIA
ncbi:MAG: UDP-3-O-acyl-N-acetylglucosamine deacetylase [Pseudomonadota bacterium]